VSVFVDNMEAPFGRMIMCHMIADSTEELCLMACKIGVARKWIQKKGTVYEHFDICQSKRNKAIAMGAVETTKKDLVRMLHDRRKKASK